ncbi:MAG: hypothetical protein R3E84_20315 [Pseudomonadales bacterium]
MQKDISHSQGHRFEPEIALAMVAFHRELEFAPLLESIFSQAALLTPASFLKYANKESDVEFHTGEEGQHTVNYSLQLGTSGVDGGEVKFSAPRRFSQGDLDMLEGLLRLAAPPLPTHWW